MTNIKNKIKAVILAILGIGGVYAASEIMAPPLPEFIPSVEARFDWTKSEHLEDKSKRTHTTKHFQHPTDPTKKIMIQSSGLLHYHDGEDFKELPKLEFPEGKITPAKKDKHYAMDLPAWGREELSADKQTLIIYDKKNQPIYIFTEPFVASENKPAYIPDVNSSSTKPVIKISDEELDMAEFHIEDHKLYFKLPETIKNTFPLRMYDDTFTATSSKDNWSTPHAADTNYSTQTYVYIISYTGYTRRAYFAFDISSLPAGATISDATLSLYWYFTTAGTPTGRQIDVFKITRNDWVEAQQTWNNYKSGSAWTTPGGDYVTTNPVGATTTIPANFGWINWDIKAITEDAVTNTVDVNVVAKMNIENEGDHEIMIYSKEYTTDTTKRPYIEITYTEGGARRIILPAN